MLVTPEYVFKDVTRITPAFLAQMGIRALVLDVDNTLTEDRSQELSPEVAQWLEQMRAADIRMTIVSNGTGKRVGPFAQKLGMEFISLSAKPLPLGLMRARRRLGVKRSQMAMSAISFLPTVWPLRFMASPPLWSSPVGRIWMPACS